MSHQKAGTFGTLPDWVLTALPTLDPTSILILCRVAYASRLRRPALTLGALIDYTGRSPKQVDRALRALLGASLLTQTPDGYVLGDVSKTGDTQGDNGGDTSGNTSGDSSGDTSGDKNVQEGAEKSRPAQQIETPEEVEEDLYTYLPPKTERENAPSQPVSEMRSAESEQDYSAVTSPDFRQAAALFHRIVNAAFVSNNSAHLVSWAEQYSEDFLRLAWDIARTDRALSRVPMVGLVWLLQGTKPWPEELKKQFTRDKTGAARAEAAAPISDQPQPGEIRVCGERSGRVLDVDVDSKMLTLQIGADASDSLWVPWSSTQPAVKVSA